MARSALRIFPTISSTSEIDGSVACKSPPDVDPATGYEAAWIWDHVHREMPSGSSDKLPEAARSRLDHVFRQIRSSQLYGRTGSLYEVGVNALRLIGDPAHASDNSLNGLMKAKGRPIAAVFDDRDIVLTQRLFAALSDEELLQLFVHARTWQIGTTDPSRLQVTYGELIACCDGLKQLNLRRPGSGLTLEQIEHLIPPLAAESVVQPGKLMDLFESMEIDAAVARPVMRSFLSVLASLRERQVGAPDDSGPAGRSALDKKLDTVLLNAAAVASPVHIAFVSFGSPWHYALWNNLSIDTLAGDLYGEFGADVRIEMFRTDTDESVDLAVAGLAAMSPDIIGLSVELGTLTLVDRFVSQLQRVRMRIKPLLVLGNQVPTYFPEKFVWDPRFANAIICPHEGELAMRGLVEHVREKRPLSEVPNLVYRDQVTEKIVRTTAISPTPQQLIHPSTVATAKPGITNMVQASRGCIFACSFCTRHVNWDAGSKVAVSDDSSADEVTSGWRPMALSRVFENVERLVAKGITEIEFCDDEFFGGRSEARLRRVNAFADGMRTIGRKYGTPLTFRLFTTPLIVARSSNSRTVQLQNRRVRDTLEKLVDSGLVRIYIGLDSGSVLQKLRYNRAETLADTTLALRVLRGLRIDIDVGFIMFDPHLTVAEMMENVSYFRDNNLVAHNTWPFRPLVVNEGTALKTQLEAGGLLTGKQDPEFLAYEYRFADPAMEAIFNAVQEVAQETAPIFYTLKTISKAHWRAKQTEETRFAQHVCEDNALVYLELMERWGEAAVDGRPINQSITDAAAQVARAKISELVDEVEARLQRGLFDERHKDRQTLMGHLNRFRAAGERTRTG